MLFVFLTTECPLAIHGPAICKPCESHSYVGVNMGATLCKNILQPKLELWLHKSIWAVTLLILHSTNLYVLTGGRRQFRFTHQPPRLVQLASIMHARERLTALFRFSKTFYRWSSPQSR